MTVQSIADMEDRSQEEVDRDSLHTLPLCDIPIETPALRRARLIKNSHLDSVIEVFNDVTTGCGQLSVRDAPREFGWPPDGTHPDQKLLNQLAALPSYDVYSLRVLLRKLDIEVNSEEALKLSPQKTEELNTYMQQFTRPLVLEIFGEDGLTDGSFQNILAMFRDPDVERARQRLERMAERLGISIFEVPRFLEDYGDIFLSFSYYRQCLDQLAPSFDNFQKALVDIRENYQLRNDQPLMQTCDHIETVMNELLVGVTGRFENFERSTSRLWEDLTAARFKAIKDLIRSYHTTIGGVLCTLTVKMDAWNRLFPDENAGGPVKRAEFIVNSMKQGIDRIKFIEDNVPMLAALK